MEDREGDTPRKDKEPQGRLMAADKLKPPRYRRVWTDEEKTLLEFYWGAFYLETIARKLGRSPGAVRRQGRVMRLGPKGRGYLTMTELSRRSGFCWSSLKIAAERIGVRLRRIKTTKRKSRRFAIDEEDAELIVAEALKHGERVQSSRRGEWGVGGKPNECRMCGQDSRRHVGRGLCVNCHQRARNGKYLDDYPLINPNRSPYGRAQ